MQTIQELSIPTNKIFYDKKTEVLSIYLFDIVFIGTYKKSTKLSRILDDVYNSLDQPNINREKVYIVDFVSGTPIPENTRLKNLALISKKQAETPKKTREREGSEKQGVIRRDIEEAKTKAEKPKASKKRAKSIILEETPVEHEEEADEDFRFKEEEISEDYGGIVEEREMLRSEPTPRKPISPPPEGGPAASRAAADDHLSVIDELGDPSIEKKEKEAFEKQQITTYEINMGLQYYSVMMEQTSYLFYVYFSHKELKIVDEEGKTVFETTFKITTTKKEPPILNLRVEGEGFEVHPLYGKVEVNKKAINPPVMIFSVLPLKKKGKRTKKEKKEGFRRHLHVYVEFEDQVINHSILSIIVQPKHFHLDIGPFHFDVSKKTAMIISFVSILVAVASLIYTLFSIEPSSQAVDIISNFAPGLGSIIFVGVFLYTLFKEGLYPLKEKISYFLNFDQSGMIVK